MVGPSNPAASAWSLGQDDRRHRSRRDRRKRDRRSQPGDRVFGENMAEAALLEYARVPADKSQSRFPSTSPFAQAAEDADRIATRRRSSDSQTDVLRSSNAAIAVLISRRWVAVSARLAPLVQLASTTRGAVGQLRGMHLVDQSGDGPVASVRNQVIDLRPRRLRGHGESTLRRRCSIIARQPGV